MKGKENMRISPRIEEAYRKAQILPLKENDSYVFFSDCHRGYGGWNDNFAGNQNLCFHALQYYYERGFHYVEIGDGDELWENGNPGRIIENYSHIFWMMRQFYQKNRLIMLWGNHDNKKRKVKYARKHYAEFYNECSRKEEELFPDICFREAVRLQTGEGRELFLIHGHQGDLLNDYLHPLAGFLVRYFWKPLEKWGIRDPTRPAYNYRSCIRSEKRFRNFADKYPVIVVCGHTHRPVFPKPGEGRYFNDGSMVHPRCIIAIELTRGTLSLVKWSVCSRRDGTLYVCREVLEGPHPLKDYFENQVFFP